MSLKGRLLAVEDDFLYALSGGEAAIIAFDRNWQTLLQDIDSAVAKTNADAETLSLAHTVSLRIALLADASADLYTSCDSFTSQLMHQVDSMMSELTIYDHQPSPIHYTSLTPDTTVPSVEDRSPRKRRNVDLDDCIPSPRKRAKRRRYALCFHNITSFFDPTAALYPPQPPSAHLCQHLPRELPTVPQIHPRILR